MTKILILRISTNVLLTLIIYSQEQNQMLAKLLWASGQPVFCYEHFFVQQRQLNAILMDKITITTSRWPAAMALQNASLEMPPPAVAELPSRNILINGEELSPPLLPSWLCWVQHEGHRWPALLLPCSVVCRPERKMGVTPIRRWM